MYVTIPRREMSNRDCRRKSIKRLYTPPVKKYPTIGIIIIIGRKN